MGSLSYLHLLFFTGRLPDERLFYRSCSLSRFRHGLQPKKPERCLKNSQTNGCERRRC